MTPAGDYAKNGVRAQAFKSWFGDWEKDPEASSKIVEPATGKPQKSREFSKVIDSDGDPVIVFHGTTHDFDAFNNSRANVENHMGAGFYFSSSDYDADRNYAGEGPDLTSRISSRAEDMGNEIDDTLYRYGNLRKNLEGDEKIAAAQAEMADELDNSWMSDDLKDELLRDFASGELSTSSRYYRDDIRDIAAAELSGGEARTLSCYLNIRTPVVLDMDKGKGTNLELMGDWNPDDEDAVPEEGELIQAIHAVAEDYPEMSEEDKAEIIERLTRNGDETCTAQQFSQAVGQLDNPLQREDPETGSSKIMASQFVADVFKHLGYDGVIYADASKFFPNMGIPKGTRHFVAWQPNQIKSAGNEGTFDPGTDKIDKAARERKVVIKGRLFDESKHPRGQPSDPLDPDLLAKVAKGFNALAMVLKDFDEGKHPRGQPGNAGQFGNKPPGAGGEDAKPAGDDAGGGKKPGGAKPAAPKPKPASGDGAKPAAPKPKPAPKPEAAPAPVPAETGQTPAPHPLLRSPRFTGEIRDGDGNRRFYSSGEPVDSENFARSTLQSGDQYDVVNVNGPLMPFQMDERAQQLHDLNATYNVPPPATLNPAELQKWDDLTTRMNSIVREFNALSVSARASRSPDGSSFNLNAELVRARNERALLGVVPFEPEPEEDDDPEPEEWDGVVNQRDVNTDNSEYDHIDSWSTWGDWDYDHERYEEIQHTIEIETGTYTVPETGEEIEVYRWQSTDNAGDQDDGGIWTADRSEAERDGVRFGERNGEREPDPPEEEEPEDEGDFGGEDAEAIFGATKLGLHVRYSGDNMVSLEHEKIETCDRTFHQNRNGEKYIHNDIFMLKKRYQGDGFGTEVFYAEVEGAKKAGFDFIETYGARSDGRMNGYYTWLTMGYDQSIDDLGGALGRRIKELVPGAKTMQDMMAHTGKAALTNAEVVDVRNAITSLVNYATSDKAKAMLMGKANQPEFSMRDWWLAKGVGLPDLKFDLHDGSRSLKIMQANLAKRAKKKAGNAVPAAARPAAPVGAAAGDPAHPTAGQRAAATRLARETAARQRAAELGKPAPLSAGQRAAATRRRNQAEARAQAALRKGFATHRRLATHWNGAQRIARLTVYEFGEPPPSSRFAFFFAALLPFISISIELPHLGQFSGLIRDRGIAISCGRNVCAWKCGGKPAGMAHVQRAPNGKHCPRRTSRSWILQGQGKYEDRG